MSEEELRDQIRDLLAACKDEEAVITLFLRTIAATRESCALLCHRAAARWMNNAHARAILSSIAQEIREQSP